MSFEDEMEPDEARRYAASALARGTRPWALLLWCPLGAAPSLRAAPWSTAPYDARYGRSHGHRDPDAGRRLSRVGWAELSSRYVGNPALVAMHRLTPTLPTGASWYGNELSPYADGSWRMYDDEGRLVASLPADMVPADAAAEYRATVRRGRPVEVFVTARAYEP